MPPFDPDTYHVRSDLGEEWPDADVLAHIQPRIRQLACPLSALIEDPSNVRKHPDGNLEGIRGSYAKYKQRVLIVVNKRTMIVEKGNGSLACLRAGEFQFAAVLFVDDDPATATGFAIADNRTAESAEWDLPALFDQLQALKAMDYEVPSVDDSFFNELEVLVKGASFSPLEDVDDDDAGDAGEAKIVVALTNPIAAIQASAEIQGLLDANPEWGGSLK